MYSTTYGEGTSCNMCLKSSPTSSCTLQCSTVETYLSHVSTLCGVSLGIAKWFSICFMNVQVPWISEPMASSHVPGPTYTHVHTHAHTHTYLHHTFGGRMGPMMACDPMRGPSQEEAEWLQVHCTQASEARKQTKVSNSFQCAHVHSESSMYSYIHDYMYNYNHHTWLSLW